jgi:hypothetical protein
MSAVRNWVSGLGYDAIDLIIVNQAGSIFEARNNLKIKGQQA